jgi:glycosyltransferase involved in cell wall biosynthesis
MPRVLFVSRTSESRAHTYRVLHPVEELGRLGWKAEWVLATDSNLLEKISAVEVVVVSRGLWGPDFMNIRAVCLEKGVRLICDVDDLTFEPEVMAAGFAYLDELSAADRERLLGETGEILSALTLCDAVTASTRALAREASRHARGAFVLPNCFSREMLAAAGNWRTVSKPSAADGLIRIGFASGTPTHTRDFATIAEAIADVLQANPNARLVVVGYLDLSRFPCLDAHSQHIEQRPVVPLANLHEELARFDINLAPLEIGNPFCEAKSEIRFTAAAALGIPTVAAATDPMRQAILHGETGLLATRPCEWREHLQALVEDSSLRGRLGEAARIDTRLRFGPEKTAVLAGQILRHLILNFNRMP